MRAECFDRLIDPRTHAVLAAYGWISERKELIGKYWVSVERDPYLFFSTQEAARQFFKLASDTLKARSQARARSIKNLRYRRKQAAFAA